MLYNLPNGKVIYLTLEEYLTISDEEIQFLIAYEYGEDINDYRHGSILEILGKEKVYLNDEDLADSDDTIRDVDQISSFEKMEDEDIELDSE